MSTSDKPSNASSEQTMNDNLNPDELNQVAGGGIAYEKQVTIRCPQCSFTATGSSVYMQLICRAHNNETGHSAIIV